MPQRKDPDTSERLDPVLAAAYKAEADKHKAEARYWTAEAEVAETFARKALRSESLRSNPRYFFTQEVDEVSIRKCMKRLDEWDHDFPDCDVEITFTSPGGNCIDGFALWDYLMEYRNKGHCLMTHTLGMAASMAGVLLQAGDRRYMGAESFLLIHNIATTGLPYSKIGEVEDELLFLKKLQDRFMNILASRSTLSVDEIKERADRRDWWLNSEEALALGFIDEVV
jgi:ATP-dependent protease ClpP protease subunit